MLFYPEIFDKIIQNLFSMQMYDQSKYDSAKCQVKGIINLPDIIITEGQCVSVTFETEDPLVTFLDNSRMGYASFIGTKYVERKTKWKRYQWGCLVPMGTSILLALGMIIYDTVTSSKEEKQEDEDLIAVEVDPYDTIEEIVNQLSYPIGLGNGMSLNSIYIDKSNERLKYDILVNTDSIDMDLLKEHAKSNFMEVIQQGDIKSQELQFWLYCMQNDISIVYEYNPQNNKGKPVIVLLSKDELKEVFRSRRK